jgi:hypothetical protein
MPAPDPAPTLIEGPSFYAALSQQLMLIIHGVSQQEAVGTDRIKSEEIKVRHFSEVLKRQSLSLHCLKSLSLPEPDFMRRLCRLCDCSRSLGWEDDSPAHRPLEPPFLHWIIASHPARLLNLDSKVKDCCSLLRQSDDWDYSSSYGYQLDFGILEESDAMDIFTHKDPILSESAKCCPHSLDQELRVKLLAVCRDLLGDSAFDELLVQNTDSFDATALHRACTYSDHLVVRWLLGTLTKAEQGWLPRPHGPSRKLLLATTGHGWLAYHDACRYDCWYEA